MSNFLLVCGSLKKKNEWNGGCAKFSVRSFVLPGQEVHAKSRDPDIYSWPHWSLLGADGVVGI